MPNAGPTETRLAHEAGRQAGTPPKLLASATAHPTARCEALRAAGSAWKARRLPHRLRGHRRALVARVLALLVPDLFMAGYLRGTRLGAQLYNVARSSAIPAGMVGLGWWQSQPWSSRLA